MNNLMQVAQLIQQFKSNPLGMLQQMGIPQNCNDPDSVVNYLLENKKVTQEQIDQAKGFYNTFFKR